MAIGNIDKNIYMIILPNIFGIWAAKKEKISCKSLLKAPKVAMAKNAIMK